jgi:hypothetical protein
MRYFSAVGPGVGWPDPDLHVPLKLDYKSAMNLHPVDRRADLDRDAFEVEYLKPLKPVILSNFMDGWPARDKWTFEYFKNRYGDVEVPVFDNNMGKPGKQYLAPIAHMPLRDFIGELEKGPSELRMFLFNLVQHVPELAEDYRTPTIMDGFIDNYPFMFFGGVGAFVRMHYDIDLAHVFLSQFQGRKRVMLFPPSQSRYIYHSPFTVASEVNFVDPDYDKYPALRHARGYECIVEPGETLFMPSGYWHFVTYPDSCFSLSLRANESLTRRARGVFNIARHFVVDKGMNTIMGERWMDMKKQMARRRAEDLLSTT